VALQVLGAWGDGESLGRLRTFIEAAFDRQYGWSIRGVAIRALFPHVRSKDVTWVLDLYFNLPDVLSKHELFPLVLKLSPDAARERLKRALKNPNWKDRQAAVKAIGNMSFPDKASLLLPLLEDENEEVRASVRALIGTPGA
jgi:HEAT repeat protein